MEEVLPTGWKRIRILRFNDTARILLVAHRNFCYLVMACLCACNRVTHGTRLQMTIDNMSSLRDLRPVTRNTVIWLHDGSSTDYRRCANGRLRLDSRLHLQAAVDR